MKILILIAFSVSLVACSVTTEVKSTSTILIDRALFAGTWHCATPKDSRNDEIKYDGKTTYASNGLLNGQALFYGQLPDVKEDFLYEINISGTWELKNNEVHEYISNVSIKPLNDFSSYFEEMFRKTLEKRKKSVSTILAIDNKKVTWRSESGTVDSCKKVLN